MKGKNYKYDGIKICKVITHRIRIHDKSSHTSQELNGVTDRRNIVVDRWRNLVTRMYVEMPVIEAVRSHCRGMEANDKI